DVALDDLPLPVVAQRLTGIRVDLDHGLVREPGLFEAECLPARSRTDFEGGQHAGLSWEVCMTHVPSQRRLSADSALRRRQSAPEHADMGCLWCRGRVSPRGEGVHQEFVAEHAPLTGHL